MTELKFVLVGTGNIANTYSSAFKKVKGAAITAVVSRNIDGAKKYAAENNIPNSAVSLHTLKCEFDAIIIATPNGLHYRTTEEAAALGKHVLCEKPLDITIEHMDRMINACKKTGVKLGTTYQYRMSPDNKTIKNMFLGNMFGKIYALDLAVKFYRSQSYYNSASWRGTMEIDGGGPFMQQASHNIDLLRWFLGMPQTIFAKTGTLAHTDIEVEDHGIAVLGYKSGTIVTIIASTLAHPGVKPAMEVFTERGSFVMKNNNIIRWEIEDLKNPAAALIGETHSGLTAEVVDTTYHEAVINDFIEAVQKDRDPIVPPQEARQTTELILGIYKSAKEKREITL
ncbi:MAG: Gfo/Idh/MocA family oxidoreductase [Candidatus Omnitrophica bacterium]|nr:Gfo/Idh/MocA family oxidoreductase [Candidatus Omnitrophota bacterium]